MHAVNGRKPLKNVDIFLLLLPFPTFCQESKHYCLDPLTSCTHQSCFIILESQTQSSCLFNFASHHAPKIGHWYFGSKFGHGVVRRYNSRTLSQNINGRTLNVNRLLWLTFGHLNLIKKNENDNDQLLIRLIRDPIPITLVFCYLLTTY